ncbi:MAG TPA: SPOR domain-containing protein [Verrucomicrobiae bacterium]|nr:SPOR domain-containing protein [Verrucomicrobiae bacterium]
MASGGKRGAGERVLEGKHVIGLFLLMLLFSGVFFTLGYVMGRNQYDGQVSAAITNSRTPDREPVVPAKPEPAPKQKAEVPPVASESDPATSGSNNSDWEFYGSSKLAKGEPHLEPVPKASATPPAPKTVSSKPKVDLAPPAVKTSKPATNAPLIPNGALLLQVAALTKQDDALSIASSLQKKHFAAYVQTPQKDKFYRVQVGPFKEKKAADAAKKGLESEGFKAFYVNR